MSNWKRILVPVAALALLAACGGGDGGGGGGGGAGNLGDKSFPAAAATQTFANSAVDEVNGLVEEIQQAELAGDLPVGVRIVGPPTGATSSGDISCSTLGTTGSGTISYTFTYSSGGKPVSYASTYHDCSFSSGGYTFTYNGKITEKWGSYQDEDHYTFSVSYDLTYAYVGPNFNFSGELKSAETCTQDGEDYDCHYEVGGGYALGDYTVSTNGNIITIGHAVVESANATLAINNWVYNTALGRATSGTITITFNNGNSVLTTATGTGYTVAVTINGSTTNWNVAY